MENIQPSKMQTKHRLAKGILMIVLMCSNVTETVQVSQSLRPDSLEQQLN